MQRNRRSVHGLLHEYIAYLELMYNECDVLTYSNIFKRDWKTDLFRNTF